VICFVKRYDFYPMSLFSTPSPRLGELENTQKTHNSLDINHITSQSMVDPTYIGTVILRVITNTHHQAASEAVIGLFYRAQPTLNILQKHNPRQSHLGMF
jgi:hypothetical protein